MRNANNYFDTDNAILAELYEYADINKGVVPDHIFSQACSEFCVKEDDVMKYMIETKDYQIDRTSNGFVFYLGKHPDYTDNN